MTRDDVKKRLDEFMACLREERELRDDLEELEFMAENEKSLLKAVDEQTRLLKALQLLREERILPLLTELAEFVSETAGDGAQAA